MTSKIVVALAIALLCPKTAAVVAQPAADFCALYETTCAAIGANFVNTAACEAFYTAADAGTLGNPIQDTAFGPTRACYQNHLGIAATAPLTISEVFSQADTDGDKMISFDELLIMAGTLAPSIAAAKSLGKEMLRQVAAEQFKSFDDDGDGKIDYAEYPDVVNTFGLGAGAVGDDPKTASARAAVHCPHARGTTLCVAPMVAQSAADFCAAYETNCAAIGTNFVNIAACEAFYTVASAGSLESGPGGAVGPAHEATRACYQFHLNLAVGDKPTHCPHAKGTSLCVGTPADELIDAERVVTATGVTAAWPVGAAAAVTAACLALF